MLTLGTKGLVVRPRLVDLIERPSLAPITLVTAPAGYGKSTLVSQWAGLTAHGVAWVALGPESNSPGRLLAQIATALRDAFRADDSAEPGSFDDVVDCLDALARAGRRPVVVVDDLDQVENHEAYEAMAGMLGRLSDGVHMILISRTVPALPLGRLRAEGRVRELTENDLRFTPAETADVVERVSPSRLTAAQIATLDARTEGWITGIRLALASLERVDPSKMQSIVDTWPASHWLDDYIVEEVLAALPEDVGEFVLRTANLPELTPDLCDAVLGIETSAALIDEVRRWLVFVRPVDVSGEAVAYHALFAESAGRIADRRWPVSDRLERLRRAALWYERVGRLEAAIEQAIAAEDWEIAERCIRPLCRELMDRDDHHSRLYWLRKLPEARVLADPDMARWYISALQYAGQLQEALRAYAAVEPAWLSSGNPLLAGHSASTRCFFSILDGDDESALELAHEALTVYPPSHALELMHAWAAVHQIEFRLGNDDHAEDAYRQAARCREMLPAEQAWWTMQVQPLRANHQALWGNLHTAQDLYEEMLETLPAEFGHYEAKLRSRLAAILLERNDLSAARRHILMIERLLEDVPRVIWQLDVLLVLAQVYEALDDTDGHARAMHRLREFHRSLGGTRMLHRIEALQVAGWLVSGKLGMAREWMERTPVMDRAWVGIFGDNDPRLAAIQVMLADGQNAQADHHLRVLIDRAETRKLFAELIPLCVWQAAARQRLGDVAGAVESLRAAIRHGMPGGFVRAFLTPGYDLAPLLERLRPELTEDEFSYARRVLAPGTSAVSEAATPGVMASRQSLRGEPDAPLSDRETEVMHLLHAGCTNQEVADRLFITERTVKKHVGNILRKLGVSNRTAAVLRALELGLL